MEPAAQYLFEQTPVTTAWLVAVRLLVAGGILTAVSWHRNPVHLRELTRYRWAWWHLLGYSVLGTLFSQLAYFLAVKASNAATATVLQYLQPVLIILWVALATRKWPRRIDNFSVLLALLGTFLLITDGQPGLVDPHALGAVLGAVVRGCRGFVYPLAGPTSATL